MAQTHVIEQITVYPAHRGKTLYTITTRACDVPLAEGEAARHAARAFEAFTAMMLAFRAYDDLMRWSPPVGEVSHGDGA